MSALPPVKKSAATINSQWRVRNSFHVVFRCRSGAGSMPLFSRIFATVPRPIRWPRFESAPKMRRYPQSRFSIAIFTTSASIFPGVLGRPGPRRELPSYFWAMGILPCWPTGAAAHHSAAAVGHRAVVEGFDFLRVGNQWHPAAGNSSSRPRR
jgi:hypothetical protein